MIEYDIRMTARCDGCGQELEQAVLARPMDIEPTRWAWQRKWKKSSVMLRERKYRKPLIFCQPCADGKQKAPNR